MSLSTSRLLLRPVQEDDLSDFFEFYSQEEVCQYLPNYPWTKENQHDAFHKKKNQQNTTSFSVVYQDKVIGEVLLMIADMKDTFEIGYVFHPEYARQGFAFEAVSAVIEEAFIHFNAHRVYANLDTRNIASKKLCEKQGMRQEAYFIEDYWSKDEWTNSYIYGILKKEWLNKKETVE